MNGSFIRSAAKISTAAFLLLTGWCLNSTRADDWPHWRGPNFNDQSTETGLLQEWPEGGPEQLWTFQKAGLGYAGISIVGDQLFTLGLDGDQEFALCLNAETGKEVWRTPVTKQFSNGWGDGPRGTPSVDGDRVYALFAGGVLACLNKDDGEIVWQVKMQDFGGEVPNWGYAESPLVDGNKVVVTPGGAQGTILALDKTNGEKIWQSKPIHRESDDSGVKAHYSSLVPADINGQHQYIQLLVSVIVGVNAKNGDVLWQVDWPGKTAVIPSPIVSGGQVYVTSGYAAGSKLIEIGKDNEVTEVWYSKDMQNHHGGVLLVDGYLFGSSARAFVAQDKKTGKMVWPSRNIQKGALGWADGLFYHVQENDGKVLLLKADEKSIKLKGQFVLAPQSDRRNPQGRIWVHPVISDGKLYLRDQEIIYCYDVKKK